MVVFCPSLTLEGRLLPELRDEELVSVLPVDVPSPYRPQPAPPCTFAAHEDLYEAGCTMSAGIGGAETIIQQHGHIRRLLC